MHWGGKVNANSTFVEGINEQNPSSLLKYCYLLKQLNNCIIQLTIMLNNLVNRAGKSYSQIIKINRCKDEQINKIILLNRGVTLIERSSLQNC